MARIIFFSVIFWFSVSDVIGVMEILNEYARECQGSHVGFGLSGDLNFHYEALRRRYKDCTHVEGNLEITNLDSSSNISYDLSFLSKIEVVTGYVLIGLLDVEIIPLTRLKLIRADNTYNIMGEEYGLVVALTAESDVIHLDERNDNRQERNGLVELQLPSLREISRGRVLFSQNPKLRFVNTINWHKIVPGKEFPVFNGNEPYQTIVPFTCDQHCEFDTGPHCWGADQMMCQRYNNLECHPTCPGRCFSEDILGCCHPECAVGCYGPLATECEMCKYFKHDGTCLSMCPYPATFRHGQDCIALPVVADRPIF